MTVTTSTGVETRVPVSVAAMPEPFLWRVRHKDLDDLGQSVRRVVANGGEPCRDVLRRARPGERLILASFTPFTEPGPYKEYGPVFVLAEPGEETVCRTLLPRAGRPEDYLREHFVVRAYSATQEIIDAAYVDAPSFGQTVDGFFNRAGAAFLHVRFPAYGCFALRIDRRNADGE